MLHKVSETVMHRVRWVLALGWLLLIASLFYDPITPAFTEPSNQASPFHLSPFINSPEQCIHIRDACMIQEPYAMGALIWWAMIVPAGIFILLVLGHEFWRRICPLSFMSQIPRALGIQRKRKVVDRVTGETRFELVTIGEDSWLGRNHLYFQSGLFFISLGLRILFVNADRVALGSFLIASICCSILVGYLYAGKSWCHYFCPMAPVQMIYTGPRSLLGSETYLQPKPATTQSMCRTVTESGQEMSACVSCKSTCFDIDAEKTYWTDLKKPGRRLLQYGYLGMVIAFYLYYFLYAGNWDYYFTGAWTHEDQIAKVNDIGFYIYGQEILIPKFVAVYITFAVLTAITFALGLITERLCRQYVRLYNRPISAEQAQHITFTLFTATSFWVFFSYGARPSLNRLPPMGLLAFNALVVLVGSIWLFRTIRRDRSQYERESMTPSLRRQLAKLEVEDPSFLGGRNINQLTPDELYTVVKVLHGFSQRLRLQTYEGVVLDLLTQQAVDVPGSLEFCQKLRQDLELKDSDHFDTLETIAANYPEVLAASRARPSQLSWRDDTPTSAKTVARPRRAKS